MQKPNTRKPPSAQSQATKKLPSARKIDPLPSFLAGLDVTRSMIQEQTNRIKEALSSQDYANGISCAVRAFRYYPSMLVRTGATREETAYPSLYDKTEQPPQSAYPTAEPSEDGDAYLKRVNKWMEDQLQRPPPINPLVELEYSMLMAAALLTKAAISIGKEYDFDTWLGALRKAYGPNPNPKNREHKSLMGLKHPDAYTDLWPDFMDDADWKNLDPETKESLKALRHALSMMQNYNDWCEKHTVPNADQTAAIKNREMEDTTTKLQQYLQQQNNKEEKEKRKKKIAGRRNGKKGGRPVSPGVKEAALEVAGARKANPNLSMKEACEYRVRKHALGIGWQALRKHVIKMEARK